MTQDISPSNQEEIIYPETDGMPMAENTKQFKWIVLIKENLEILFASNSEVFVAGDLFWYPVEGDNTTRLAPDIMVVFGCKKGDRGSYQQWNENNIVPQVVFEILSPGNRPKEMENKFLFYQKYGVEEYYIFNPDKNELAGYVIQGNKLEKIPEINGWISPRLGIRFELKEDTLEIFTPSGEKFLTPLELSQERKIEQQRAELERQRAELEYQRAESEYSRAETEKQRAETERQEKEQALAELEAEKQRYQALMEELKARGIDF